MTKQNEQKCQLTMLTPLSHAILNVDPPIRTQHRLRHFERRRILIDQRSAVCASILVNLPLEERPLCWAYCWLFPRVSISAQLLILRK